MKRLTTLLLLAVATTATAAPDFSAEKKYHIECQIFTGGCVADGNTANQQTPLYYLRTATTADHTYWLITEEQTGKYSIRNAKTQQYITYDGVRDTYRRYVSMTDQLDGDNSLWTFPQSSEGIYAIRNCAQTDHIWDVRTDSYMVGTYSNTASGNTNQLFKLYDADGNQVFEKESTADGWDVSSWLTATTESMDGWNSDQGLWWLQSWYGGPYINGDANCTLPFIEAWVESPLYQGRRNQTQQLSDRTLTQQITNLPAGDYTLKADIIATQQADATTTVSGVSLYLGKATTAAHTEDGVPEKYAVSTTTTGGNISCGVSVASSNANWVAIDNVSLYFQGTADQLLAAEREKVASEISSQYSDDEAWKLITEAERQSATTMGKFQALEALRKGTSANAANDPLQRALGTLLIGKHGMAYDNRNEQYLCPIPLDNFGTDYQAVVSYTPKSGWGKLNIDGEPVDSGQTYTFKQVEALKTYTLTITSQNGTVASKQMTFTSLPVVQLWGDYTTTYNEGTMRVYQPTKKEPDILRMKAKYRGGITNGSDKHKRNYSIKFLDENGDKEDQKFFGLRNDNHWILEACQVDMSRVRNRVLTDLWNDMCTPPYYADQEPKALTGTRGQFVELILNGEYHGIYCMYENLDRKQMKLKKYDDSLKVMHGQLWKSKDWSYAVFMGHYSDNNNYPGTAPSSYSNYSESWDQYYVKYPDIDDVKPTDWSPLWDAVNFVCTSTDREFYNLFGSYFDYKAWRDYYILMETILSTDNHGKNLFFAIYDQQADKRITPAVWDLDATCGQRWSDVYLHASFLGPEQDYAEFITHYEHGDYNLFKRMRECSPQNFNENVRYRYRELREGPLNTDSILQRFKDYIGEFQTCGAADRESERWSGDSDIAGHTLDFDDELEYITDWFTRRMNYLDKNRFDIGSLPAGIDLPQQSPTNDIYTIDGRLVRKQATTTDGLPAGIYIMGGKKVVVK